MNPSEITVIVYRAKGLQSKRKNKHKFNVTFGIGNNKAKSENVDEAQGNPEWNTEAALNIDDPMEPLILKVKDKDDILGQISLHMHELPTSKPARPKSIPLQPHKKCPNPQGDLVFEAYISAYSDEPPPSSGKSKHASKEKALANQMAQFKGQAGSRESIGSALSGFSTMSEATKKKSTLKKLKGAFKHSPKLGGGRMNHKASAQSCMDLTYSQGAALSVQNIDFKGSDESLASQGSALSKQSGAAAAGAGGEKKSKNPFKKMLGKSPLTGRKQFSLSKKNSSSMHDLAFGGGGGLSLAAAPGNGSSESIDKLANKSRMDADFPDKFDITAPTALLATIAQKEEQEKRRLEEEKERAERQKQAEEKKKKQEDNVSVHSISPKPSQRRRLSVQTRSLRDDPRLRKLQPHSSPLSARHMHSITPVSSKENLRAPTLGSSKEDVNLSVPESTNSFSFGLSRDRRGGGSNSGSLRSTSSHEYDAPFYVSTPPSKKKLAVEKVLPEITGVAPAEGSIIGGTKLTVRGTNLGLDKDDVICLNVCGANCLASLEYVSDRKLLVTTKAWKPGPGKIIVETQSGGRAHSLVEFTFVEDTPKVVPDSPKPTVKHETDEIPASSALHVPEARDIYDDIFGAVPFERTPPPAKPRRLSKTKLNNDSNPFAADDTKPNNDSNPFAADVTKQSDAAAADTVAAAKRSPPPKPMRSLQKSDDSATSSPSPQAKRSGNKMKAPSPPSPVKQTVRSAKSDTTHDAAAAAGHATSVTSLQLDMTASARLSPSSSDDLFEGQERLEPEGMTTVKEHKTPEVKHVDLFGAQHEKTSKPTVTSSSGGDAHARSAAAQAAYDQDREELIAMIQQLREEKSALQEENTSMKGYMSRLMDKIMDQCPELLCIDPNGGSPRTPLKLK